ncbi:MAG: hypothetical protein ACFCVD_12770 [Nodosilinea sp.]
MSELSNTVFLLSMAGGDNSPDDTADYGSFRLVGDQPVARCPQQQGGEEDRQGVLGLMVHV